MALVVVGSGGGQCVRAQDVYPSWFVQPPSSSSSVLWAVGYGPGYSDLEAGMEEAKADAYESLRRAHRVVVLAEKLYRAAPGYGTALRGQEVVETGLPDTLRAAAYVDSVQAGDMTLVLAAWPEEKVPSQLIRARRSFSASPPSWVGDKGGGDSGRGRAVGIAPRYYNLETSWQLAEERARRKLAFEAATKVRSLEKSTEDWQDNVQSVTTGVDLRDVQVRARWADDEHCYVLTSARVEEVLLE